MGFYRVRFAVESERTVGVRDGTIIMPQRLASNSNCKPIGPERKRRYIFLNNTRVEMYRLRPECTLFETDLLPSENRNLGGVQNSQCTDRFIHSMYGRCTYIVKEHHFVVALKVMNTKRTQNDVP